MSTRERLEADRLLPPYNTSLTFGRRLREAGILPSMGSRGDAFDNALAESFWSTLERELLDDTVFVNRAAARLAVFN